MQEEWKEIPNTNGRYGVSSFGNVYDNKLQKNVPQIWNGNYLTVNIVYDDGKKVLEKVHRLVAVYFVAKDSPNQYFVKHIDGDRNNNSYLNLRWYSHMYLDVGINPPRKHGNLKSQRAGNTWKNILARCYNHNCKHFSDYGGRGVVVAEEFLDFEIFQNWYLSKIGIYCNEPENTLEVDKDILVPGNLEYSSESCVIVPRYLNYVFRKSFKTERKVLNHNNIERVLKYLDDYGDVCDTRLKNVLVELIATVNSQV